MTSQILAATFSIRVAVVVVDDVTASVKIEHSLEAVHGMAGRFLVAAQDGLCRGHHVIRDVIVAAVPCQ